MIFEKKFLCVCTVVTGVVFQKMPQAWSKSACKREMTSRLYQGPFLLKCCLEHFTSFILACNCCNVACNVMFLLTSIGDSLQCSYIFTLGVLLLYLKGILMLLPSCLYLCVYIQCSVNREGRFYTGLANMPSNLQSTLPDALFLLTVLISSGDAELIMMWVLNLGMSSKLRGHFCTKWYLEIIFFRLWQSRLLLPLPAQVPGLMGREHLPVSFPMATAGWRGIFPGFPDEWSLIAVGEGFASPAQCTTDSSWQPYEGGLRQPGHSYGRKSTNVTGLLYCWRMCFQIIISLRFVNVNDV